jgi:hypothetical protein
MSLTPVRAIRRGRAEGESFPEKNSPNAGGITSDKCNVSSNPCRRKLFDLAVILSGAKDPVKFHGNLRCH